MLPMAKQELVIETGDLSHLQIFCGNPNCWSTVTYLVETLRTSFHEKCPACGTDYPESVVAAVEHYVEFFENAIKTNSARMNLRVQL
jgi:hypothetical protein